MEALLTTAGFIAVTAASVAWHLRRTAATTPAAPSGPPCPRCQTPAPPEADSCPRCGAPRQIFELVSAQKVSDTDDAPSEDGPAPRLHALVRADRCVGCGTCAAACPEAGAIALQGKLAVVNVELCTGQGECVRACPIGAIGMAGGAAVQRVEVPEVDADFQSTVRGLYVVGELGGRGLIKNAINEGKIAAEAVARELGARPSGESDAEDEEFDLVVVGSGPAGLSAALEAHRTGLRYTVLEQGSPADTIRKYPRHKLLLAEPVRVPLYGDLWVSDASKETLIDVWDTIISSTGLRIRTGHKVENVLRESGRFRVCTDRGDLAARRVILALGRRGLPRKLGVPGEEAAKVLYDVVEMEIFAESHVLVVGGGDSAVESALGLANQSGTTVHLSYRGTELKRVKDRNRDKFAAAVKAGKIVPLWQSRVLEILPESVTLEVGGEPRTLPNDFVIVRIGGEAPYAMLERIGVSIVQKDVPLAGEA